MSRVLMIAEAGVNHNGDLGRARAMVAAAAAAGADLVKFQAFCTDDIVTADAEAAPYQMQNTGMARQNDLLRGLEITPDGFAALAAECREHGIGFLCTPFDVSQTAFLIGLGMGRIKVASGELTNTPALHCFAKFGLPILLSTGMATLEEVGAAVAELRIAGCRDVTILHCTSLYPAPENTVNLRAMTTMREAFGTPVGYSDHTLGDEIAIAAVALGACVIEKHFTLDRTLPGPDHRASLEPSELSAMIRRVRAVEAALGDGVKRPAQGEAETAQMVRRSWHAARELESGTVLTAADITLKRPADGLAPATGLIGRHIRTARRRDAPIRQQDLVEERT
jgi:N,N'-diacetyllegionaminate synthase